MYFDDCATPEELRKAIGGFLTTTPTAGPLQEEALKRAILEAESVAQTFRKKNPELPPLPETTCPAPEALQRMSAWSEKAEGVDWRAGLQQNDVGFLSAIGRRVEMWVADPKNGKAMERFRSQLACFGEKWQAYRKARDAWKNGTWNGDMGEPANPLGAIWHAYGTGWERPEPRGSGLPSFPVYAHDAILPGAYVLLAVVHDMVVPGCARINDGRLPDGPAQEVRNNVLDDPQREGGLPATPGRVISEGQVKSALASVERDLEPEPCPLMPKKAEQEPSGTGQPSEMTCTKQNSSAAKAINIRNLIVIIAAINKAIDKATALRARLQKMSDDAEYGADRTVALTKTQEAEAICKEILMAPASKPRTALTVQDRIDAIFGKQTQPSHADEFAAKLRRLSPLRDLPLSALRQLHTVAIPALSTNSGHEVTQDSNKKWLIDMIEGIEAWKKHELGRATLSEAEQAFKQVDLDLCGYEDSFHHGLSYSHFRALVMSGEIAHVDDAIYGLERTKRVLAAKGDQEAAPPVAADTGTPDASKEKSDQNGRAAGENDKSGNPQAEKTDRQSDAGKVIRQEEQPGGTPAANTAQMESKVSREKPWDDNLAGFILISKAREKYCDGPTAPTLPVLGRDHCKPNGEFDYMKNGHRCKVHEEQFAAYVEHQGWTKAAVARAKAFIAASEKPRTRQAKLRKEWDMDWKKQSSE